MPYASIMPTGGVAPDEANLTGWFKAGVHCVGMGSQLFPKEVLAAKDWSNISSRCRSALDIVRKLRS
jgi:2-dehydro-3-deoxyphosphogluconate aldolase/(4S)-4-hydroxy-2-oxoglutarate aldolase